VLASMGQTLQSLSNGRFVLGLGRSAAWRWRNYGQTAPTLASMGDTADILRRLWAGETVTYDGPAGTFPELRLPQRPDVAPPPIVLAAIGPKGLELAGRNFDGVILHPFLTPDAVGRSVEVVRKAATEAGRDPEALRCYSTVVIAPEMNPHDEGLAVGSRAAGYLHVSGLGDAIAKANGWSADDLLRYRNHPTLVALGTKQADKHLSRDVLVELSQTMPPSWLPSASATGSLDACVGRLNEYLDAGADEIVLHGATAETLGGLAQRFEQGR
jgi:5,10-methylenetetrahydromethanopterin reductase